MGHVRCNKKSEGEYEKYTGNLAFFRFILFILGFIFLSIETYYITAFINSYSLTLNNEILLKYKDTSRFISSAGIALSMFITSFFFLRRRLNFNPFGIAILIAIISGISVYSGVERAINEQVRKAPEEAVLCGFLGGFAKKSFLLGTGDAIPFWNEENTFTPFEEIQVGLNLLPAALCTNKKLLINSVSTTETYKTLSGLVSEKTHRIYREQLDSEINYAEKKLNLLKNNIDKIYGGHRKVLNASSDSRFRSHLKRFEKELRRNGMSYSSASLLIEITEKTRKYELVNPSKSDLYESIVRNEMSLSANNLIRGKITLERDLIKDMKIESEIQVKQLINEVVSKWSRGLPVKEVSVPDEMREVVRVIVAPLVLMAISGLSIILTATAIASLLIPEMSKKVAGKVIIYKVKYYFYAVVKGAFSPFSAILMVIFLMPISPTQAFFMKDMDEGNAKFIMNNLLKAQFYIYPTAIKIYSKIDVRPTLKFSKKMLESESDIIRHFENTMIASSRKYQFTTPSIQSVIFSGIAISNYKPLTNQQKKYIENAKIFYMKSCSDKSRKINSLSCLKRDYLNTLYLY